MRVVFWFQYLSVDDYCLRAVSPDKITEVSSIVLNHGDCMLISMDNRYDNPVDFKLISKGYFDFNKGEKAFNGWGQFAHDWENIVNNFPVHDMIYTGKDFNVYLYCKRYTKNSKEQYITKGVRT